MTSYKGSIALESHVIKLMQDWLLAATTAMKTWDSASGSLLTWSFQLKQLYAMTWSAVRGLGSKECRLIQEICSKLSSVNPSMPSAWLKVFASRSKRVCQCHSVPFSMSSTGSNEASWHPANSDAISKDILMRQLSSDSKPLAINTLARERSKASSAASIETSSMGGSVCLNSWMLSHQNVQRSNFDFWTVLSRLSSRLKH